MERELYQQIVKFLIDDVYPPERILRAQQKTWKNFCKPFRMVEDRLF